jgi:hypothetical protein
MKYIEKFAFQLSTATEIKDDCFSFANLQLFDTIRNNLKFIKRLSFAPVCVRNEELFICDNKCRWIDERDVERAADNDGGHY